VTSQALADDLSSAAEVLMGESDEAIPIVLVHGVATQMLRDVEYDGRRFAIGIDEDVFLRSLADSSSKYA
jgi:F420-0:gamma-glutamyl ligase